ncbi:MAG: LamG domain-containing protein [Deltaproteobacteria bacterium]|nr:LamG domain-containing protein [Deltaproteobacteria bacterium]
MCSARTDPGAASRSGAAALLGTAVLLSPAGLLAGAGCGEPFTVGALGSFGAAGSAAAAAAGGATGAGGAGAAGTGGGDVATGAAGPGGTGHGGGGGPQPPPPPGFCDSSALVGCYRFDGDVADGSSQQNHATASGVQFAPGVEKLAIVLGAQSLVRVPETPSYALTELSIEIRVYPDALPAEGREGIADHDGRWGLFLYPDGICCAGGGAQRAGAPIPAQAWTHVACTIGAGTITVYLAGAAVAQLATGALDTTLGQTPISVGSNAPSGDPFLGRLDGLRLFGTVRSPAEICAAAGGKC